MKLRVKQMTCGSLTGVRITQTILAAVIPNPEREAGPLKSTTPRSWSIGIMAQRAVQGDVKEEIVVRNACGEEPGSHESKAILLSHDGSLPLPKHWPWQQNNREVGLLVTHAQLNNRVNASQGAPLGA